MPIQRRWLEGETLQMVDIYGQLAKLSGLAKQGGGPYSHLIAG